MLSEKTIISSENFEKTPKTLKYSEISKNTQSLSRYSENSDREYSLTSHSSLHRSWNLIVHRYDRATLTSTCLSSSSSSFSSIYNDLLARVYYRFFVYIFFYMHDGYVDILPSLYTSAFCLYLYMYSNEQH